MLQVTGVFNGHRWMCTEELTEVSYYIIESHSWTFYGFKFEDAETAERVADILRSAWLRIPAKRQTDLQTVFVPWINSVSRPYTREPNPAYRWESKSPYA